MVEINLYVTYDSWYREKPDGVIRGRIIEKNQTYIEIQDDSDYTQVLMLNKFFAITYKRGEYIY